MLPKETRRKYRLRAVSLSLFLLLAVYDKQWSVSCEYTRPLVLPHQTEWSQRTEQSPVTWDTNNERRIINNCQKAQRIVFFTNASALSLHTGDLEATIVHSRRYMFLRKRRSCEYRHCRCLARIAIALNRRSVFGQIQYTKPPENLCLLNKLLLLVPVRVLTWRCYMIGVYNFDHPKLMPVEHISLMPSWCLSLTNTRQDTRQ